MKARMTWTTSKVLYLYLSGALLGASLILLLQAVSRAEPIRSELLGVLLALGLAVLPVLHAARPVTPRSVPRGDSLQPN